MTATLRQRKVQRPPRLTVLGRRTGDTRIAASGVPVSRPVERNPNFAVSLQGRASPGRSDIRPPIVKVPLVIGDAGRLCFRRIGIYLPDWKRCLRLDAM